MGTETKLTCYSENATNHAGNGGTCSVQLIKGTQVQAQIAPSQTGPVHKHSVRSFNGHNGINGKGLVYGKQCLTSVPFVPIHIDENSVIDGAREVLKVIRSYWDLDSVNYKKFTDGITNKLVGCFYTPIEDSCASVAKHRQAAHTKCSSVRSNGRNSLNGSTRPASNVDDDDDENNDSGNLSDTDSNSASNSNSDTDTGPESGSDAGHAGSSAKSTNNVVLVRVYGNKTDLLIDRKAETRNFLLLHSYGFAPALYATFKNGLAYDYVPGVTLNTCNVLRPDVWHLVACRMADMHRMVRPHSEGSGTPKLTAMSSFTPMLWKKTQAFFDLVPERFSDAVKHKRLEGTFLPITRMRQEFDALYKRLAALGSPIVFCHNDLLLGNVVYTEPLGKVTFIDYEYADYNFQAFDIGNHFAEFAGVDEVDYARYPQREFQLAWLRVYLQAFTRQAVVSDAAVERLYVQVNQFALAAHFFWTIWSLIQAEHSKIDFDYVDYAFVRYNEYLAKKDEFLALTLDSSS